MELGLSSLGFFDWLVVVDGLCSAVVVLFSVTDIDLSGMFSSPLQFTHAAQTDAVIVQETQRCITSQTNKKSAEPSNGPPDVFML